ncbi:L-threonine O-3-phosphate decarboxylase (fragment), partial [Blastococcus saxobsidens]|uniref:L-threonine O-3-phosphate decarboxylase n=1 Tax=Blastococcus saxobsidens (strain DD2) TaxID=1146883 RepID=H6RPS3_BLASD
MRRGETFPGLTADHLRVAVRDPDTSRAVAADLAAILGGTARPRSAAVAVPAGPEEIR